jgi:hypothetical protein
MENIRFIPMPPRHRVKCGWSRIASPTGACKQCGEPAEPGAKRLCINCEIESGLAPVKPDQEKIDKKPK